MKPEEWKPIRITINYSQLYDDYDDEFKCTKDKVGKNITWGPYVVMCTNELLLDKATIDYTIEAFENVRKYLESMLKVKRIKCPYIKTAPTAYGYIPNITYSDTDLYITVFPRIYPKDRGTVASSVPLAYDHLTNRPIQGCIVINIGSIKEDPKTLYNTFLHEIVHILGINCYQYHLWHSHENNEPYGDKYISQIEIAGINRTIINAPYSHNFAVNHYGVETFKSGSQEVRSGIILENSGEPHNALSHVDSLYYFNELMVSKSDVENPRLTEVTMSLLMDTGYYKVDYTKGKPMWWGSKETNNGEFIKDFITGPPQKTFPYNYLMDPKRPRFLITSGFDYSFVGAAFGLREEPPEIVKQNIDWYNPLNSTDYGDEYTDYQRIVFPLKWCENGTAGVNFKDDDAECLQYEIDGPNILFFDNETGIINCTKRDEEVTGIDGRVVICPDPSVFAARINLRYRNTFDHNPLEIKSTAENDSEKSKVKYTKVCRKSYRYRWFRRYKKSDCYVSL